MKSHSIVIHNERNEKTTQVIVNADEILELLTNDVPLNSVEKMDFGQMKNGSDPFSKYGCTI